MNRRFLDRRPAFTKHQRSKFAGSRYEETDDFTFRDNAHRVRVFG
jgi:hypothetical protein